MQAQRARDRRPCLTINKLPSFIRQVVNDARLSERVKVLEREMSEVKGVRDTVVRMEAEVKGLRDDFRDLNASLRWMREPGYSER